jgi:hypothetical protein
MSFAKKIQSFVTGNYFVCHDCAVADGMLFVLIFTIPASKEALKSDITSKKEN